MKRFLKFLKWTGITLGTLLVLFIAINAFDETLEPGAAAILNAQPKVKVDDNAYLYLAGMYTETVNNPSEIGKKCSDAQLQIAQAVSMLNDPENIAECPEQNVLKLVGDQSIACDARQKLCLKQYFEKRAVIDQLAEKNKLLLERYEQLLAFKQFEDVYYLHPFGSFPEFPPANLFQAISVSQLHAGNMLGYIRRTAAETEFYRMVLRGESSVLYRMIAIAWLERSARLVSEAVQADVIVAQRNQTALLQISRPLSVPERDFGRAMAGELRSTTALLHTLRTYSTSFLERWLYWPTIKRNASSNYFYRNVTIWRDLTQLPTEQYLAAEKRALEQLTNPLGEGYIHLIYNPVGKILVGIGAPVYADYPRRIIDADGLLRLVSLQIQIAAQKIPESEIPDFLKNADPQYHDPYTGHPMQWDKTRGLYFRGYSDRITDKDGFVSVKL